MAKKESTDWNSAFAALIKKYKGLKHPLEYKNLYQLMVMVILSAQDSDRHINDLTPPFFKKYPDLKSLRKVNPEDLYTFLGKVRGSRKKIDWILRIAEEIKDDKNIPVTMEELIALPGIGRKSANVIMREAKVKAEGIMVDLHVVRVAQRLGVTSSAKPEQIEKDLMENSDASKWGEVGMAISFLGRETCRPTDPHQEDCVMNSVCQYYKELHSGKKTKVKAPPKKSKVSAKKTSSVKPAKKS